MIQKSELIKPNEYYSPRQIHQMGVFKWIGSYETLKNYIKKDIEKGNNIFHTIRNGSGNGTRYLVRGATLINLQEETKKGKVF